jgi:hypothetical protein
MVSTVVSSVAGLLSAFIADSFGSLFASLMVFGVGVSLFFRLVGAAK